MKKTLPKKIQNAVDEKELISYADIKKKWSLKKRARIGEKTHFIMAAMKVRELREKQKLSQSTLAKKMHVKREFISRVESGGQNITLDTLYRIGEALGKEVEFTFR